MNTPIKKSTSNHAIYHKWGSKCFGYRLGDVCCRWERGCRKKDDRSLQTDGPVSVNNDCSLKMEMDVVLSSGGEIL